MVVIRLRCSLPAYHSKPSLICDFCPSDQRFAYSFLQIPPHGRHPCCLAIHFPLPGHVRDSHPLERAHGAQTYKKEPVGSFFHLPAHKQVLSEYLPKQLIGTPKYIIRCHDSLTSDWFDTCLLIFRQKNIHL